MIAGFTLSTISGVNLLRQKLERAAVDVRIPSSLRKCLMTV
jgi:hypothetical protein